MSAAAVAVPNTASAVAADLRASPILRDRIINFLRTNRYYRELLPFLLAIGLAYGLARLILTSTYLSALYVAGAIFIVVSAINPRIGFLTWLFVSPVSSGRAWDVGRGIPALTFDRITLMLLFTIVVAQKAVTRRRSLKTRTDIVDAMFYAFAGIAIVSALFPARIDITRPEGITSYSEKLETATVLKSLLDLYVLAFGAFWLARALLDDEKWLWRSTVVVALMPFYLGPVALVENLTGRSLWTITGQLEWQDIGRGRAGGPFVNPISFGLVLGTCWVLGLYAYFRLPGIKARIAVAFAIGWAALATFVTYTRGAWATVVGRLLLFAVAAPRMRKAVLIPLVLTALVVVGYRGAIAKTEIFAKRITNVETIEGRIQAHRSLVNMVKARPLFGFGAGRYRNYQYMYGQRVTGSRFETRREAPSHNTFLAIMADIGLIGFLPYLVIFTVMGYRAIVALRLLPNDKSIFSRDLVAATVANIFGYIISAFIQDNRYNTYPEYQLWTSMAVVWLCHRRALAARAHEPFETKVGATVPGNAVREAA